MNGAVITLKARSSGLALTVSPDGGLRAIGEPHTLERWLEPLRSEREPILAWLSDESTLRTWLIADGDTEEGSQEVIDLCARDPQARDYFLQIAKQFLEKVKT
jgi:hypothetical protein